MKDFAQLTNRGRALRLRRMALVALQRYDLDVQRVRLLSNDLNGIFRVDTSNGQKLVLRVCLPEASHTLPEIRSEMMWLEALSRDTDLGVPEPLANREGALVTTVEVPGVPQARHCVVFGWMPGPDLADRLTLENVQKMGELSARLHAHAMTFDPPSEFSIKTADSVFPFGDEVVLFDKAHRNLVPPARRELFRHAEKRVEATLGALYANWQGFRVLHYDLHHWNLKVFRGKLYALDFEDLMWGYPVQDVAVSVYYFLGYEEYPALWDAFKRGYLSVREWPERGPGEIDALVAGRGMMLANYILQDANPDYQEMVPEFVERVEGRLRMLLKL